MSAQPKVLIFSGDALARDLLIVLLRQEQYAVVGASEVPASAHLTDNMQPNVVILDAIDDVALATEVLEDPERAVPGASPALVLLAGSVTPRALLEHPNLDRVLMAPQSSFQLVEEVRYQATLRPRRYRASGLRVRKSVSETFRHKRGIS